MYLIVSRLYVKVTWMWPSLVWGDVREEGCSRLHLVLFLTQDLSRPDHLERFTWSTDGYENSFPSLLLSLPAASDVPCWRLRDVSHLIPVGSDEEKSKCRRASHRAPSVLHYYCKPSPYPRH
jgi:hypothetical protein